MVLNARAEALELLPRSCSFPCCDNLDGDSEADLTLRACGTCGTEWYCRRECQVAHWQAGHKEVCGAARQRSG